MDEKLKDKFIVIKKEDVDKCLNDKGKTALYHCLEVISDARSIDDKRNNSYLVVNQDEPYAGLVKNLILNKVSVDDIPEEIKEKILKEYAEDLFEEFQQVERFEGKITFNDVVDILQIGKQ